MLEDYAMASLRRECAQTSTGPGETLPGVIDLIFVVSKLVFSPKVVTFALGEKS